MKTLLSLSAFMLVTLPVAAQHVDAPDRIVVAEVEAEAIRPLLTPAEVASLVEPEFESVMRREEQRPRFEQSWIERGDVFRLTVDAQFPDGNDYVMSLPLETVRYGERQLLVLVRPRS